MVALRLMGDDPDRVRRVGELLRQALEDSGLLLGDYGEAPNRRGGGIRLFTELIPAPAADPEPSGPIRATAERADQPSRRTSRPVRGRRELPPGRTSWENP